MSRAVLVLSLLAAGACTAPQRARALTVANALTLATSTTTLAVDYHQTYGMARLGWRDHHEGNPIMGTTPSTGEVSVYFASAALINAALWVALPPRWRSVVPIAVIGVQLQTISANEGVLGHF